MEGGRGTRKDRGGGTLDGISGQLETGHRGTSRGEMESNEELRIGRKPGGVIFIQRFSSLS